jgi:hypothetical protein
VATEFGSRALHCHASADPELDATIPVRKIGRGVSAHISNMLRKTGTANRIELTQLVRRLSATR